MWIPWALVAISAFVVYRWCVDCDNGRAVPLILIWDALALLGFFLWAGAAKDVWGSTIFGVTIAAWSMVGVGSILMTALAMHDGKDGNAPPPKDQTRQNETNFVAPSTTVRSTYKRKTPRRGSR